MKFRVFWDVLPCSQVDVDIYLTTQQYIPHDSDLHTRRRENLNSYKTEDNRCSTILLTFTAEG
jgi:hypothetical protein